VLKTLDDLSIAKGKRMMVSADAGYFTERDLKWAEEHRDRVDVLIHEAAMSNGGRTTMDRSHFTIPRDGSAPTCPAGTAMAGPYDRPSGVREWKGVGCDECPLRASCTSGSQRTIVLHPEFERLREQMRERMSQPDAAARYAKRIATVEPVFSNIQDTMGFRRVSTRLARGVRGEIFLKFLAHNIARLIHGKRLRRVYFLASSEFWATL
jgi:transposase